MGWAKLDDRFPDHPKVVALSDRAFRAYVTALCYCAAHLTDGAFPATVGRRLAGVKGTKELLSAGLWLEQPGGYEVHDYLVYNPSREEVEAKRTAKAMAGAKGAAARWHGKGNAPVPVPLQASPTAKRGEKPTNDTIYLGQQINESWPGSSGRLSPPALQRFVSTYGARAVEDAVRELHGFPPAEAVKSPYAYVESILRDRKEAS